MRFSKISGPFLCAAVLASTLLVGACRDRGVYHDPYYHDDHPAATEEPNYQRWEQDTHRTHVDLEKRNQEEQKQYWDWRHQQH